MPAAHSPFEAHHGDSKLFGDAFKNRVDEKICRSVLKIIEELNTRILDAEYLQCLETKLRFSFSSVVTVVVEMCGEELTNLTTNFIDTLRRCQEHVNNSQSKVPEDLTSMSTSKNSKTTGKSGDAHVEVKEEWIEGVEVDEMDPTDGIICLGESASHAAVDSGRSAEISIQIVGSSSFVDFEGKSEDKTNMFETVVPFAPQRSVKRDLNVSAIQGYAANEISTEASNLIRSTNTSRKRKFRHSDVGEDDSADDGQLNNQGTRQRTSAPITNRIVISPDNSEEEDDDDNISSDLEENIADRRFRGSRRTRNESKHRKLHACFYCGKLLARIDRHLFKRHHKELEVEIILSLPKQSEERVKRLALITRKGDFNHNVQVVDSKEGKLLLVYGTEEINSKNANRYSPCPNCFGFMTADNLSLHVKICPGGSEGSYVASLSSSDILAESRTLLLSKLNPKVDEDSKDDSAD